MKKDYKNHPFKVNDVVYHFEHGKGVVTYTSERYVHVMFDDGERSLTQFAIKLLSFTPCEINSDWERPYEPKDGDVIKIVDYGGAEYEAIFWRRDSNNKILTYSCCCISDSNGMTLDGGLFNSNAVITQSDGSDLFTEMERNGYRWNPDTKKLEKITEEPKVGDLVIAWNYLPEKAVITTLKQINTEYYKYQYRVIIGEWLLYFINAVKFESMEQYEKIRRGEI